MQLEAVAGYLRERPFVVAIIAVLGATYVLSWVLPLQQTLALIVANTLLVESYPWNLVTAHLYEHGLIKLLVDVSCVAWAGRSTPSGQLDQFALYMALSLTAAGVGASLLRLVCFSIDHSQDHLTKAEWGAGAVAIALAMYTRVEHATTPVTPYSPLTYNHAIPVLVAANVLLSWVGFGADGSFSIFAFLFCWSYLRHLYRFPDGNLGERSQDTEFVKMFPAAIQPALSIIATPVEKMFARLGVFGADLLEPTPARQPPRHHLRSQGGTEAPLSSSAYDPVKERRMQLARKMLEERREVQQQMDAPPMSV